MKHNSPETDQPIYDDMVYDKYASVMQWGLTGYFNKLYQAN